MTSTYDLISEKDYESLPDDPESQFIALEAICRRNMSSLITAETPNTFDVMVRLQYMSTVSAAASELGLDGLPSYESLEDPADAFDRFLMSANGLVTKLRLRNAGINSPTSVRLTSKTKRRIEYEIERLRTIIISSSLETTKQEALMRKLDELLEEVHRTRVRFSMVMATLAAVGLGLGGATSFLADAPNAIATITSLLGQDKEEERQSAKAISGGTSLKALPAPNAAAKNNRNDDEIPF